MDKKEREDLFRFLIHVDTRLNEIQHDKKSLEARVESLTLINDWAEAQNKTLKRELEVSQQENIQLRRKLQKAELENSAYRKELQIAQEHNRFIEQDRDALDLRVRDAENQRKRIRKSYNELNRNLDDGLRSSEAMMDLKKFLMN